MGKMNNRKSLFYGIFLIAIAVVIGVIIIKAGRQTPKPEEKPQVVQVREHPVKDEKSTTRPQPIAPKPEKKEPATTEKTQDKDSELTISGKVTLSDGSPAAKAEISITRMKSGMNPFDHTPVSSTTADQNGNYSIGIPNYPVVFVKASCPGYASLISVAGSSTTRRADPSSGGKHRLVINFTLPPASYMKGQVVDEEDNPLKGASVTSALMKFENQNNFSIEKTVSDSRGRFAIQNIPPGKIMIGAALPSYAPESLEVTAPSEDVILKLVPAAASLSGRVFHKQSGEPVTSATVRLIYAGNRRMMFMSHQENKAQTDPTGFFSFDGLAAGNYVVRANKEGLFMLATGEIPNNRLELKENDKKQGVNLYLYEGHSVKGSVTDIETNEPLEGVRVHSTQNSWGDTKTVEDITGPDGFYMLEGLSGSHANIAAEKENYILERENKYSPYIRVALDPKWLELTKELQMIPGVFISGRVETDQGVPVTDAQVYLYQLHDWQGKNKAHPVDRSGGFKLVVTPFTRCFVKAGVAGFPMAFSDLINVQNQSIEDVIIVMKPGAGISGMVQDEENNPVDGARIRLRIVLSYGTMTSYENLQNLDVFSDSSGRFKAVNLPSGQIVLNAEKENYAKSKQEKINVNPGEEKNDVILELTKPSFLAGTITDPDGNPLENVQIHVYTSSGGTNSNGNARTDEDGHYRIEGLYDAPHNVNLHYADYGGEYHQDVEVGREDADFVMGAGNKITLIGNVKDWKTGDPIEKFKVSGNGVKPEKDPETPGRFVIKKLNPKMSYRLKIESEGYRSLDTGYIKLPENEDTIERTYELGPGGGVKGRVVNKLTQIPLEGVDVYVYDTSNEWEISQKIPADSLTTREDGLFNFEELPAGTCSIHFIPPQPLKPSLKNAPIKHGDMTDMGDVEMTGGGIIRGKLVQMPDEILLQGKTITLQGFSGLLGKKHTTTTDDQGRFEFKGVQSGRYSIRAVEYNISEFAEVMEDEANEYILRVGTGALKGVVLKNGKPQIANVHIRQTHIGTGRSTKTDSKGAFEITGLVPGTWKITFYMGGYTRSVQEHVEISPDKVTEKTFELPSGRIVGKVVNENNEPVKGARVSARLMQVADAEDGYTPKTWSDESDKDGAFVIADLLSSSYAVSATKTGFGLVLVENVIVPDNADSAPVLLRLEKGKGGTLVSVALNLTNAQPVPEAWCYLTTAQGVRFDHGKDRGPDGVITIPNIPSGTYRVQVSSFGFSVHEHIVEIKEGETVELEDVMYEAGALRWTVLDGDGHPVPNAPCRIEPIEANSIEKVREGPTDSQGLWIQRGLYPGSYRVTTRLEDGRQATDTIQIDAHQLIQKNVVVK